MSVLILFVFLTYVIRQTSSAVCGDTTIGTANPVTHNANIDSTSNTAYVMTDASYQFTCCGRIKTWRFYAGRSGTIKLQVWRLSTGTTFTLVGENSFVIPGSATNNEIRFEVPEHDRIQFNTNDYVGWHTSGNDIIPYSGSGGPDKTYYKSTTVSTGTSYTFSSFHDNTFYAIIVDVTTNENPYFDNIPDTIHVFDHLAISTGVLTLDPKDTTDDTFSIVFQSANAYFSVDSTTYIVSVASSLSLTTSATRTITPKLTDICSASKLDTVSIYVENQKPVITSLPDGATIIESATAETLLHSITAVDGETLTCQLGSVIPTNNAIKVKETSVGSGAYGVYYVPVAANGFDFDFDTAVMHDVTVTCTDGRRSSDVEHLMVYIEKNTVPVVTNLPYNPGPADLDQQTIKSGHTIQVSVTDTDTLLYTMTCDPTGCPFTITQGGLVTTSVDLSTIRVPAYDVHVNVNDGHTTVGPKVLSIHISNINDIPEFANYEFDAKIGVEENIAIGTTLFTYTCTDLDDPDIPAYSWTSNPSAGTTYFSIGATSGQITTIQDIDFETLDGAGTTDFVFTVKVTDGKDTASTMVTLSVVNVNEPPSFSGSNYIVNDVEGLAEKLLSSASITATDPDAGDNALLKYTLDCNGYNTTYFEMDENNANIYFGRDFDTDVGHPMVSSCNVTVTDKAGLTDTEFLTINIADTNDFTPSFELELYTVFLFPYEPVGTILGNFTASDGDISTTWSTLVYALDQSSLGDQYFDIDSNGTVTIAKDISTVYSNGQKISIPITATDGGGLVGDATLLFVFPETSTSSTTTTEMPFRVETYADNGYLLPLIATIVLMNICMCVFLCYKYADCLEDKRSEEEKREARLKEMEKKKSEVKVKFLPLTDPWSTNTNSYKVTVEHKPTVKRQSDSRPKKEKKIAVDKDGSSNILENGAKSPQGQQQKQVFQPTTHHKYDFAPSYKPVRDDKPVW